MTIKERAQDVVDRMWSNEVPAIVDPSVSDPEVDIVERAITEAVRDELETCRDMLERMANEEREKANSLLNQTDGKAEDGRARADGLHFGARAIRARKP